MKNKSLKKNVRGNNLDKEKEEWIKEVLLKNGMDINKEKNLIKEKAENFKNNPRVTEIQMAFNIIINEIVEMDLEKEEFYTFLIKRLKEFSKSFEKFQNEKESKKENINK